MMSFVLPLARAGPKAFVQVSIANHKPMSSRINTNKIERWFMDGCFDGLHYGHIHALYQAKQKCNTLIVATHEDSEIKKYKNKDPIYSYNDRYYMLKYCKFIDILKEESTEYNTTIDILDKNKCNKFFHGNK